jgi:glycosyltransferase involved in cell wall biosynthesis
MLYFCEQVLPLVRKRIPGISLSIVGNKPPAEVQRLASDSVTVTGYVPHVEPYLASSMVSICPLRFGAGLKGKIGEAMMHGLPVVTTSIGTQGMNARIGEDILVGDSPEDFADCVARLLQDRLLWNKLSTNGRALVIQSYSFAAVERRVRDILDGLESISVKRYGGAKRLAVKSGLDVADFLARELLWRFSRRS